MSSNQDEPVPTASVEDLDPGADLLLDVREPDEWEAGHAPGAVHLPLGELPAALEAGRVDGSRPVVAVCRSGRRSAEATRLLQQAGVPARNLTGGMQAWAAAGRPVVRADGAPGEVA